MVQLAYYIMLHKQIKVQDNETVANYKASKLMAVTFAEASAFIILIDATLMVFNNTNFMSNKLKQTSTPQIHKQFRCNLMAYLVFFFLIKHQYLLVKGRKFKKFIKYNLLAKIFF